MDTWSPTQHRYTKWKWNGHVYEYAIKYGIGFARVDNEWVSHTWILRGWRTALIVMGQLGVTELVAAKVFGFLAG